MSRFADPAAEQALADRLGMESGGVAETLAITDPAQSVRDDILRLSRAPGLPETLVVSGLVSMATERSKACPAEQATTSAINSANATA